MITSILETIKLLGDIILSTSGVIEKRAAKTPKRKFAKELIRIFSIFEDIEKSTLEYIALIETGVSTSKGKYAKSGGTPEEFYFERSLGEYIVWMAEHDEWIQAVDILVTGTAKSLNVLLYYDRGFAEFGDRTALNLGVLTKNIEKRRKIPEDAAQIKQQMEALIVELREARKLLRDFGVANLTIDDLF